MSDHERTVDDFHRVHVEHIPTRHSARQTVVDEIEQRLLHVLRVRGFIGEVAAKCILQRVRAREPADCVLERFQCDDDFRLCDRRLSSCRFSGVFCRAAHDGDGSRCCRTVDIRVRDEPGAAEEDGDATDNSILQVLFLDHLAPFGGGPKTERRKLRRLTRELPRTFVVFWGVHKFNTFSTACKELHRQELRGSRQA